MTVSYTPRRGIGGFVHLMLQWKGSIFKLVWYDLLIFGLVYFSCSIMYRFLLDETGKRHFEKLAIYCSKSGALIPVSFVLGFYVSLIIGRWWAQYKAIPWIDTMALWVNLAIQGEEEEVRIIRRTICRYVCLSITQCFALISPQVKRRFPKAKELIEAGLLLEHEVTPLLEAESDVSNYQAHWIPIVWATTLVFDARAEGKIKSDTFAKATVDEINEIKENCNSLLCFERVRVPLVYTQVVTLAVYSYFLSCIMGRQWVNKGAGEKAEGADIIIPVFTILQFLFYIGWLKVAENLVDPFGDDEYDFEMNWMVDRHLQVSYSIVDKIHFNKPKLRKDPFFGVVVPRELCITDKAAKPEKNEDDPLITSTTHV